MKKGQIKHTINKIPENAEEWVGISKKEAFKLTVEIPPGLHKKLLLLTASQSSKEKRVYMKDIVIQALEEYLAGKS